MTTQCKNCKGTSIEYDSTQGNSFCTLCGLVLEENTVVSELTFGEQADGTATMIGQFVSAESGRSHAPTIFGRRVEVGESREWTLFNAKKRIQGVGMTLGLNEHHIDQAHRWYILALQHQFTRGRRSNYIVAACLYIVCRMEKTPHMLLDFSDVLQTSVYILGGTFLRLVRLLNLQMPIIDPSFYVGRFASRLEFGEATQQVTNTALRVVARMKRDWIQVGRRPAGVCAAGLVIAARMHGFKRSEKEIVRVVHICEATLKKRIEEFAATPSSALTPEEFEGIWLENEADPPSFQRNKLRDEAFLEINTPPDTQSYSDFKLDNHLFTLDKDFSHENNQTFSDLDSDPELDAYLLNPTETATKTQVWTTLNQDYLDKEQAKITAALEKAKTDEINLQGQSRTEEDTKESLTPTNPKRSRKKRGMKSGESGTHIQIGKVPVAETAVEAAKKLLSTKRFSRKINYDALDELFAAK